MSTLKFIFGQVQKLFSPTKLYDLLEKIEDMIEVVLSKQKDNARMLDKVEYVEKHIEHNEEAIRDMTRKMDELEKIARRLSETVKLTTEIDAKVSAIITKTPYVKPKGSRRGLCC